MMTGNPLELEKEDEGLVPEQNSEVAMGSAAVAVVVTGLGIGTGNGHGNVTAPEIGTGTGVVIESANETVPATEEFEMVVGNRTHFELALES